MPDQLIVDHLKKSYGAVEAVRGVSLSVREGEILGLLGPNGAGKTTTLECIIGLRQPDAGTVQIAGIDALRFPYRVRQIIGAQLQSTSLQDKITPREALRLFGSFYHTPAAPQELIDRFCLQEKADATFDTLSGGQRQRLALALAFVNRPAVLFLDEPTTGLDAQSRRELHAIIRALRTEGHTVILSTHYIEEAHQLCDRIAVIDHGAIVTLGSPADLIAASQARSRLTIQTARPLDPPRVRELASVQDAVFDGQRLTVRTADVSQSIIGLVKLLEAQNIELQDLQIVRPSLEDVFIELTGSSLRD